MPFFDVHYSFEPKDVTQFKLHFLTNFYYNTNRQPNPTNDMYFIGTFDERIKIIQDVIQAVSQYDKKIQVLLQSEHQNIIEKYQSEHITFIKNTITFEESEKMYNNSKIILDVQKTIQKGLTFRVFEAMGKGKKLITTNEDIVNYDFYNPNNIFIWKDGTNKIPLSFFETPYEELPTAVFEKYSIQNWIKTIFEN